MGNIEIQLKDSVLFNIGQAEIKKHNLPILKKIGMILTQIDNHLIIEGHTDDIPMVNADFNSNWELSSARALSVAKFFIQNTQLPPNRLSIAGYGQYKPIVPDTTEKNRAKNRRVTIVIVKKHKLELY